MPMTTYSAWLGDDPERARNQHLYGTVELAGHDGQWHVVYSSHLGDAAIVQRPARPQDPCWPAGHWYSEAAFARAFENWLDTGRPLGPDNTLPVPTFGPDPTTRVAPVEFGAGTSIDTKVDLGPPWPPGAISHEDFVRARFSRGWSHETYGESWVDHTGRISGRWSLVWADLAHEAYLSRQPATPSSPTLPLGQWISRQAFERQIEGWQDHQERSGLRWILRATGHSIHLDATRRPPDVDRVPDWAPPGSQGWIPAEHLRRLAGQALASTGTTLAQLADSFDVDKLWLTDILNGRVTEVPATLAARLATDIGAYPEDLYGPEAAAAIAWAVGEPQPGLRIPEPPNPGPEPPAPAC